MDTSRPANFPITAPRASVLTGVIEFPEIDLTEYYDLIYEYKNDCLTAAIQYNKDYYSDKDLKPNEEIFFTISISSILR